MKDFYIGGRWEVAICYTAESQQWLAVALRVGGSVELDMYWGVYQYQIIARSVPDQDHARSIST